MNTSALKTFAPAVRRQLMEAVTRKLDFVLSTKTPDYLTTFAPQVSALRDESKANRTGLIERVAYTWFNRLAALRYLDAKGWHPFRARVLTPSTPTETQPELLKLMRTGALPEELHRHTNVGRLNDLLDSRVPTAIPNADPQGEVYRHLVLAACRFYHSLLPDLFEKLDDETELLLPDDLLTEHSVVHEFRTEITDENCAEVEVLGWLYQFYIAEKKEQIMARKSAVPTEDIPAVTQLFTPHWIVRYLVENSLGRLWLLNRPASRLREQMPYYIEGEPETDFLKINKPEEIRVLDPAAGSGHMLTYAFDLLYAIYEEEGYAPSDIPQLILRHNLHGLDIDPRAAQLASLALVLKAREKSRRFFQADKLVPPRILVLQDVRFDEGDLSEYVRHLRLGELFDQTVIQLLHQFEQATTFGSLIQPILSEAEIVSLRATIEGIDLSSHLFLHKTHDKVLRVLEQAEMLNRRYHLVVANPPYMGGKGANNEIKQFLEHNFADYKSDLFAGFIVRCFSLALPKGHLGFMTPFTWMFIKSYEPLREQLLSENSIQSLIRPEYHAFFDSAYVPICAFTFSLKPSDAPATYIDLADFYGSNLQEIKALEAIRDIRCTWRYSIKASDLKRIPGSPIAFRMPLEVVSAFRNFNCITSLGWTRKGMATGNNDKFVRFWYEVGRLNIGFGLARTEASQSKKKWFPYANGGEYRKWFGNDIEVVNWEEDGRLLQTDLHETGRVRAVNLNLDFIFKSGVTWTSITSSRFSARRMTKGQLFSSAANSLFLLEEDHTEKVLAFLNTPVCQFILRCINPTLNANPGDIGKLPLSDNINVATVRELCEKLCGIGQDDWNNFESSWDFRDLPLLRSELKAETLAESWKNWQVRCDSAIRQMQELEAENNQNFIEAYGLQDELSPEVPEDQITLARADARKDIAAFLSYCVGCIMGRYSLDKSGLILADAGDTLGTYFSKVGKSPDQISFTPDEDGIIPVLDGEWFDDDIVARTREFLRVTFGEETLKENLRFIEESLGKDLRKYFLSDFYKSHISNERAYGYKKRPIYWLVQSPQKGFSALIYLHRYTRDTMNLILNRYLRPYQEKLRSRLEHLARVQLDEGLSARDKTAARKENDKLTKILRECEKWERQTILPLAQQRIELDLDDGVKVNYQKLGEALAPIPGLAASDE